MLVVGGLLYFVLREPDETRRMLPREVDYSWVHYGLLVVLLLLVVRIVFDMRRLELTRYSPDFRATIRS